MPFFEFLYLTSFRQHLFNTFGNPLIFSHLPCQVIFYHYHLLILFQIGLSTFFQTSIFTFIILPPLPFAPGPSFLVIKK
jgi:hypothetical protein